MRLLNAILVVLLLFGSLGASQSASEPVLQMTGYDVVPATVYPGTSGQLEITIGNSGSETAKGTTLYYNDGSGSTWSVYLGDIGSASDAITTIPFTVPDKVDSGIIILTLDIYYLDEDETESKHSMSSIPLAVSQHQIMEVTTTSISKDTLRQGDTLSAALEIRNTGGVMKNVVISASDDSAFSLVGTTQQRVGDIAANSSKNVTVSLVSSSSADSGRYSIPLKITYNDALGNELEQIVNIGPVTVTGASSSFKLTCAPASESEIGSRLAYNITLENPGGSVQSAVLSIDENDVFTPIGQNTLYFDGIQPGESRSEIVYLGIDSSASSGYYSLPMTLKTNDNEVGYSAGIYVQATPAVTLTTETESSGSGIDVTMKIANSGNTAIRSLYAYAESTDSLRISGSAEKFIGTLSVDDYSSFQVTLVQTRPDGAASLPVTLIFKDNDNAEHVIKEHVELGLSSGNATSAAQGGSAYQSSNRTMGGPVGGPMGGGSQAQNIPLYAGIGIVIAGVLFLGYKKLKSKPKQEA
ncbi:MAG: hypothetical protein V1827_00735 [Candidatus Micrarchaeota archaeon]